jgi:ubiquinone/menaquinone biosynthesis C-methylase UbiE
MSHEDRRFDPKKCDALLAPERWQRWNPPELLARTGVRPGQRVLDVGCGPGFWTFPLAEIVGPAGEVLALDVSVDMLAALTARRPPAQVRTMQSELPRIDLPRAYVDFIWAAFVFHEVQPPAALAEALYLVLRPHGRLALFDWRPDAASSGGPPRHHRFSSQQVCAYLSVAGLYAPREIWRNKDAYLITAQGANPSETTG